MILFALLLVAAEPQVADQVARMASDFAALEKSFHDELVAAKHDPAKVGEANRVYNEKWLKAAADVQGLVKRHPEEPAALDGILLLTGEMRWTLDDDLSKLAIRKKDDPRMGRLCFNLMDRGGRAVGRVDRRGRLGIQPAPGSQSAGPVLPWRSALPLGVPLRADCVRVRTGPAGGESSPVLQ
jgi:hypothetical protein